MHWLETHIRIGLFSPVILFWLYRIEKIIRRFSNVAKLLETLAEAANSTCKNKDNKQ